MLSKRIFYIKALVLLFIIAAPCSGNSPRKLLEKANEAYAQNEYAYAAELYEQVLEEGYEAAGLYYNLGNAYFRNDKIAKAILNYERAKRLKPNDENILFNLHVARTHIVDRIEPVPKLFYEQWWQSLITLQSEKGWAITAIIFVLALFASLIWFFISSRSFFKKTAFILSLVFITTTSLSLVFAQKQYNKLTYENEAIVFTPRLTAKSAPDASSPNLFVIHQGTKVEIRQELGDWYEIKLANGNVGWVRKDNVEII